VYNVAGPGQNYMSLREYAACVRRLFAQSGQVRFSGQARTLGRVDTSRIKGELGWTARVSVAEGLARMFATQSYG